MAGIRGVVDIDSSLEASKPTLAIDINRDLASDLGVGVDQIGNALRPLVAGTAASTWKAPDGENYDVLVRLPRDQRATEADLRDIAIASTPDQRRRQPAHGAAAAGGDASRRSSAPRASTARTCAAKC